MTVRIIDTRKGDVRVRLGDAKASMTFMRDGYSSSWELIWGKDGPRPGNDQLVWAVEMHNGQAFQLDAMELITPVDLEIRVFRTDSLEVKS